MKLLALLPMIFGLGLELEGDLSDRVITPVESGRISTKLVSIILAVAPGLPADARASIASALRSAADTLAPVAPKA